MSYSSLSDKAIMNTESKSQLDLKVAATVAGEDIACGDYVAMLTETFELPSFLWDGCEMTLPPHEPVRVTMITDEAGKPLEVIAVCRPFVYVKTPGKKTETIDTRRIRLVRLDRRCAEKVVKAIRSKSKKKNR